MNIEPCMFCENIDVKNQRLPTKEKAFCVICPKCGAMGPVAQKRSDAITIWNSTASIMRMFREKLEDKNK